MSVELEIRDGVPWYLSPDIWAVPGADPNGAPGIPVVGQPCFIYAKVRNNGRTAVQDATVRYYWANPALGPDRTTASQIGTSFVTLEPGQNADVLCLTPWIPAFVNNGHECLIAEAFKPGLDPLPAIPDFNVPNDRHVAQRNLDIIKVTARLFYADFEVHNPSRLARKFTIRAAEGDLAELKPLLPTLGDRFKLPQDAGKISDLGFVASLCPPENERMKALPEVDIELPAGQSRGFSLTGQLDGHSALIHVLQTENGKTVGGLGVLVLAEEN